jgi:ATP-binding cassette subfamily B protein
MARAAVTVRSGEEGPPIPIGALIRRLLALAWRHRRVALPAVVATIAFQTLTLAGLAGQGLAIDVVRASFDRAAPPPHWPLGLEPPGDWPLTSRIAAVAGVVLIASILAGAARFFTRYTDERFVQACVVDLRQRLYEKLQRLPFGFFDTIDTGQVINRVTGDSQHVRHFIQGILIRAGIAAVTLGIFLTYMLRAHAGLALACFAVFPIQVLVMVRYSRVTKPKFLEQSKQNDRVVKALQESIAGVRVVRVFGRERERGALFLSLLEDLRDRGMAIARDQARHSPFVQASNIAAQAVLLGYGGGLVLQGPAHGGLALGALWIFRGLLDRLAGQAEAIVSIIGETPEALAGAERVFKLLEHPITIDSPPAAAPTAPPLAGDIEFRHVTFGYSPDRPVLHDVSFKVRAGETIAIVGPVGAGKSTLLSLIPRFYDPQAGAVLIDGVDARDRSLPDLRRAVATVFQEPFLFSNTVASNVAFADPSAERERIDAAVATAEATEFVEALPQGADTIVGERGVSLSGGQRQRLTIARALLAAPSILILDDATGAVDPLTEAAIQRSLDEQMRGRTTFIVAHRLSTLRRADRILVLDHGRIVDTGTHEDLMTRPGHYRAAALIQLALEDEPRSRGDAERSVG